MGHSSALLGSPYPWLVVSALFLGAALQRATRRARPRYVGEDPQRARTSKWLFFSLYLALAVVAALGALFVPGPRRFLKPHIGLFYAACTALFFLALRFRKTAGALTVFLLLALVLATGLFVRSLTAFTGETEIGRVRVLEAGDGRMKLEVMPLHGRSAIVAMAGTYFAPVVNVVIFDDAWVFLGAKTWYRFEGFTSFALRQGESGQTLRQQETDYYFPQAQGISEQLWGLYERYEGWIPGVRSVQVEMDLKRAREMRTYSLRVQNDGGLQIVELP
jgi:uncharacterized protein (DUF58 family)